MHIPLQPVEYFFNKEKVTVMVPDPEFIRNRYYQQLQSAKHPSFPYWAQVWPAAKAMSDFIASNVPLINGKTVLEIAAGLGLPSLLAAKYAHHVTASDYIDEAVQVMAVSVARNRLNNAACCNLNWNNAAALPVDVLLVSDINYNPDDFVQLHMQLRKYIEKGTTVILSSPERLTGKDFLTSLQPYCVQHEIFSVDHEGQNVLVLVWVLKKEID